MGPPIQELDYLQTKYRCCFVEYRKARNRCSVNLKEISKVGNCAGGARNRPVPVQGKFVVILILTLLLNPASATARGYATSIHSIEFKDSESCAEAAMRWLKDMKEISPTARPSALCVAKSK